MTEPEFDAQGYPTEATLEFIRKAAGDWHKLMAFVRKAWHYGDDYFVVTKIPDTLQSNTTTYELSTGGWSGNEEIIAALEQNVLFWTFCWVKSERGGRFTFEVRD